MAAAIVCLMSHWKSYPTCLSANVLTTTAVHLYHYCNITRPRVWRLCSSRGCLQHSLQPALHRPPGCKSASVYFAKFVHSCRERRTAPQLAACSAALQLPQLGRSWGSAAVGSCAAALQSVLQTQYLAPCTLQVRWTEYSRIL